MTRSARKAELEALRTRFLATIAEPDELRALITDHPETLGPEFDILMVQAAAIFRHQGDEDSAAVVDQYRELLSSCRHLGVAGAFVKAHARALVGGFVRSDGPDEKIAYLHAHPELDDMVNRAALYQLIEQADQHGDGDLAGLLRSNLQLIDLAFMTSPEEAVNRAYRRT